MPPLAITTTNQILNPSNTTLYTFLFFTFPLTLTFAFPIHFANRGNTCRSLRYIQQNPPTPSTNTKILNTDPI